MISQLSLPSLHSQDSAGWAAGAASQASDFRGRDVEVGRFLILRGALKRVDPPAVRP